MEINRARNGSVDSSTFSFGVTFTGTDVRGWIRELYRQITDAVSMDGFDGANITTTWNVTELDVRYFFEHSAFLKYPPKYRVKMSAWAFRQAIRLNLVTPSAVDDGVFILSDCK